MKVYQVSDGKEVECDMVDAREMVASKFYTYDAPKPKEDTSKQPPLVNPVKKV